MKKFTLTLLAAVGMLLFTTANSSAGPHFGIYIGGPGYYAPPPYYGYYGYPYYGYGYGCYPHYWHYRHGYHHWH